MSRASASSCGVGDHVGHFLYGRCTLSDGGRTGRHNEARSDLLNRFSFPSDFIPLHPARPSEHLGSGSTELTVMPVPG